jgi:hypothetical protein
LVFSTFGALSFIGKYVYDMNINHNFMKGKVYKSGVIPPDEIAGYVRSTTSNL